MHLGACEADNCSCLWACLSNSQAWNACLLLLEAACTAKSSRRCIWTLRRRARSKIYDASRLECPATLRGHGVDGPRAGNVGGTAQLAAPGRHELCDWPVQSGVRRVGLPRRPGGGEAQYPWYSY
eukprot:3172022-Pleurochrysis_carterae.AAC.4